MSVNIAALPPSQETAIAVIVAPERADEVIPAIPAGPELLGFIWWLDEVIRRANAAKKYALAEAAMAMDRMELTDPRIVIGGHTHLLRQDMRTVWKDLGALLGMLETVHGIPGDELRAAVSEARITQLREAAGKIPDPALRADALESIEQARVRVPTQLALVDVDDPYRKGRR